MNIGGDDPGLHQTFVGRRINGFKASNKAWLNIIGFTVTRTDDRAFELSSGTNNAIIGNNTVNWAYRYGIALANCSLVLVENNVVTDNQDHGISLSQTTLNCTIQDNESARNVNPTDSAANGLYLNRACGSRGWRPLS